MLNFNPEITRNSRKGSLSLEEQVNKHGDAHNFKGKYKSLAETAPHTQFKREIRNISSNLAQTAPHTQFPMEIQKFSSNCFSLKDANSNRHTKKHEKVYQCIVHFVRI